MQWGSGVQWAVPVEPIQKPWTRLARVEDDTDTDLGAGSDGEYRDKTASEPSNHANILDFSYADSYTI